MRTYTTVSPVDVQKGEREESFVSLFRKKLLFELDKVGF